MNVTQCCTHMKKVSLHLLSTFAPKTENRTKIELLVPHK